MKSRSIIDMFRQDYKLQFTKEQEKDLLKFINQSKLAVGNYKIRTTSSIENFVNNSREILDVKTSRLSPTIFVSSVIFALKPMNWAQDTNVEVLYPSRSSMEDTYAGDVKDDDQNLVIIRTIEYEQEKKTLFTDYTILIYNKAFESYGSIRLEDLPESERS